MTVIDELPPWPDVFPADRCAGWRQVRDAADTGPALRGRIYRPGEITETPAVYLVDREAITAAMRDPTVISQGVGARLRRILEILFCPKASREIVTVFRPYAAHLIDAVVGQGGRFDAMTALARPLAAAIFESIISIDDLRAAIEMTGAVVTEDTGGDTAASVAHNVRNVATMFGPLLYELVRDPARADSLREQPELIPGFVEEVIRLNSGIPMLTRLATADITIAGVEIPAGTPVLLCTAVADRDGTKGRTDELILDRKPRRHWGFGGGAHWCRGWHLVRGVLRSVAEEWLARAGRVVLADPGFRPEMFTSTEEAEAAGARVWAFRELPLRVAGDCVAGGSRVA